MPPASFSIWGLITVTISELTTTKQHVSARTTCNSQMTLSSSLDMDKIQGPLKQKLLNLISLWHIPFLIDFETKSRLFSWTSVLG